LVPSSHRLDVRCPEEALLDLSDLLDALLGEAIAAT